MENSYSAEPRRRGRSHGPEDAGEACELADIVERLTILWRRSEVPGSVFRQRLFAVLCELRGLAPPVVAPGIRGALDAEIERELPVLLAERISHRRLGPYLLGAFHGVSGAPPLRRRRARGVYYTPPALARYMARLTIRGWAAGRDGPARCSVLEPACGGGVFLVAALEELVELEEGLQEGAGEISRADRARRIAREQLCGVDVDPEALTVSAHALWLACDGPPESPRALAAGLRRGDFVLDRGPAALPRARFDIVLGNPPYDALCPRERGPGGRYTPEAIVALRDAPVFAPARGGKLNLYELFLCRGASLLAPGGRMTMIVPMALLGDRQAAGLRGMLLDRATPVTIDCFPQKDRVRDRVFPAAKLATCVVQCERPRAPLEKHVVEDSPFAIRAHPGGRPTRPWASGLQVTPAALARLDPGGRAIPTCAREDWRVVEGLLQANPGLERLGAHARQFQGELNETVQRRRGALTERGRAGETVAVLRGANLTRYCVREASQGARLFARRIALQAAGGRSRKLADHRAPRIGFQRSAPQNNFRRLIAAPIPAGLCCFDTVSYVTPSSTRLELPVLLGLLNSALYEWWFRLTSSNSKINAYQFDNLPFAPTRVDPLGAPEGDDAGARLLILRQRRRELGAPPRWGLRWVGALAEAITTREARRTLGSRRERARLAPESTRLQTRLDDVVFALFGLEGEAAARVRERATARA